MRIQSLASVRRYLEVPPRASTEAQEPSGLHFAVTHVSGLFCNASAKYAQPVYPYFDYQVARDHEIKPRRRAIPVDGMDQEHKWSHQLYLKLTVSPTGDVTNAEASGGDEDTRFWPQVEGEVYQWKFTPFKAGGKPVTATVEERVDLLPPERLPKAHVTPPAITKDSKVAITLRREWCDGTCDIHTVTVSTDGIVFWGAHVVATGGTRTR
jgi:hypothetical protein